MALRKYFYLFKLFSSEQVADGPFFTCMMQPFLQFNRPKKTSSSEDDDFLNPRKRLRTRSSQDDENAHVDSSVWSQYIGELLVYLRKSLLSDGILGITSEKTCVCIHI